MQLAFIALALASVASAQVPNVPPCAMQCVVDALSSDGCSNLTDFACHCSKPKELDAQISPCVKKVCNMADQTALSNAVVEQCSKAGKTITIPPP